MIEVLQVAHIVVFGLAAASCLVATTLVRRLAHPETRYGLYGLFVTASVWALGQAVLFGNPPLIVARVSYYIALISGVATVGCWLYFCSAYAGHEYHRNPRYRRGAVAAFVGVAGLKLTNPLHGEYFQIRRIGTPFPHVRAELFELHGAVETLAYALTAVGFYLLFQLFKNSEISTTRLGVLVGITAAPIGLNLLSDLGVSGLIANSYEPLGVAVFALGTLLVTAEQFNEIRWSAEAELLDQINDGVLVVDDTGVVREYNTAAKELFPRLATGRRLEAVESTLVADGDGLIDGEANGPSILPITRGGTTAYYLFRQTPLTIGPAANATAIVISDVTKVETQRRELERQSEQLEGFAAAVAHELRNTVTIAEANATLLSDNLADEPAETVEKVERIRDANERMIGIVDDLSTLARLSQTTTMEPITVSSAVDATRVDAEASELSVTVVEDGEVRADSNRLEELLRNAIELAGHTEATELQLRANGSEIVLTYAGEGGAELETDGLFEYGQAVPHAEAGMLGPNIETLARMQGWAVAAGTDPGFQIRLTGVDQA